MRNKTLVWFTSFTHTHTLRSICYATDSFGYELHNHKLCGKSYEHILHVSERAIWFSGERLQRIFVNNERTLCVCLISLLLQQQLLHRLCITFTCSCVCVCANLHKIIHSFTDTCVPLGRNIMCLCLRVYDHHVCVSCIHFE